MNKLTVLFGFLLCLVAVNARHYQERSEAEESADETDEEFRKPKEHGMGQMRHRRRRWQPLNYGYDYQQPKPYYQDRRDYDWNNRDYDRSYRDYDRNNHETMQQIIKLLDEISTYVKRTPVPLPPPQPIYIPYPVPYPVPQYISCTSKKPNVTFPNRWPEMEDVNQNWGLEVPKDEDTTSDGARPISFDPIRPNQPMSKPAPNVEHGSSQAKIPSATEAPKFPEQSESSSRAPGMCNAAILSCCGMTDKLQQRQCFTTLGCSITYQNGNACSTESIATALNSFKTAYSPVQ